ncbi:hypothetical protein Py04_1731 [Pyrococcus sp. ST04]|nr:hypothetical protein Py04_1731 [Pyrococcus sp. ST04]
MYHDENILCYSINPLNIEISEIIEFERMGTLPEIIRKIKSGVYPESCIVKNLPPIDNTLEMYNPYRKCVVKFTGFRDTVIDYIWCGDLVFAVARYVDEPERECRYIGKGDYKVAAVLLKRGGKCLDKESFTRELKKCIERNPKK